MAGTFGQQLQIKKEQQQPERMSRTQRVLAQDEQLRYNSLMQQAEKVRNEKFKNLNAEQYEAEYNKLSPDLRQFFATPQQVYAQRDKRIMDDTASANNVIQNWQSDLERLRTRMELYKQRWLEKSSSYRNDPRNRKNYNENMDDYELDIDEVSDKIRYFNNEINKISQGYDWTDLKNYAEDRARAQRDKQEYRANLQKQLNENPDLQGVYSTTDTRDATRHLVGVWDTKKSAIPDWLKNTGLTPSNIKYYGSIVDWSKRAGYNQLPDWAKKNVLNPSAYAWMEQNQGETLHFDNTGKVVAISSTKYAKVHGAHNEMAYLSPEEYKDAPVKLFEQANPTEDVIIDASGQVTGVKSGKFGGFFSFEEYNKKVDEYNKNLPTEEQLKQQQLTEWEEKRKNEPIYLDFVQGTTPYTKNNLYRMTPDGDIKSNDGVFDKVVNFTKNLWDKIPSPDLYVTVPKTPFSFGGLSAGKIDDTSVSVKTELKKEDENVIKDQEALFLKEIERTGLKSELDTKYGQEYQTRFEDKYMKKLIMGEIDYETAKTEFENSYDAKIVQKKYQAELEEKRGGKFTPEGWGIFGLSLKKTGLSLVPRTLKGAVLESALIYTGYKALSYVPKSAVLLTDAGLGAKATYDAFFNPKASPEVKAGGVVTASISALTLGYAGYRYLRSPVVKYETIRVKRPNVKASATIGKDLKIATKEGVYNKVIYNEQKLSQQTAIGRRTIVTSKWRELMNKYTGLKLDNIYEGIPTRQTRVIYGRDVFRGTRYIIKESAYQKALKRLMSYGYTKPRAVGTLRYYAPRYAEQWLVKGTLDVGRTTATGRFIYETRFPRLNIDEKLGITTRGGRTIRDTFDVQRKVFNVNNQEYMLELKSSVSNYLSKAGKIVKLRDVGSTISLSKTSATPLKEGAEYMGTDTGVDIYRSPALYKDLNSISRDLLSISLNPAKKSGVNVYNLDKFNYRRATLFDDSIDLTEKMGGKTIIQKGIKPTTNPSTPNVDQVLRELQKQNTGLMSKTTQSQTGALKTDVTNPVKLKTQIKNIVNIAQKTELALGVSTALSYATTQAVKTKMSLTPKFNVMNKISEIQLQEPMLKLQQNVKQEVKQDTGTGRVPSLNQLLIEPDILRPINPPRPPKPPRFPRIKGLNFGDAQLKNAIKKRAKKTDSFMFGLLPDFTSRALGLAPKRIKSVKEALREINKIQTGFEVRTGAVMSDKKLLRRLMR